MGTVSDSGILNRLATSPRRLRVVLALGLLVSLPALFVGLFADDLIHRALIDDSLPHVSRGTTELYEFIPSQPEEIDRMRDLGGLPWWSADDLAVTFFRPLPSALLVLERRVLGDAVWAAHLHTLAWFAALLILATALLRRWLSPRAATAAALVYALSVIHTTPVAWLAARYALMVAVFGLASLLAHVRAREERWAPGFVLAPLCLIAAFLCGESALGAAGLILFYEIFAAPGRWTRRALCLLPAVIVTLTYVGWYKATGYGAQGSELYVDPVSDPLSYLAIAAVRVPALFGNMLMAVPSELGFTVPGAGIPLACIGAVATVGALGAAWLLRSRMSSQERKSLCWLFAGCAAAVCVSAGGVLGGRILPIPMLAGAALVGTLMAHAWPASQQAPARSMRRWACRAGAVTLLAVHLVISPLIRVGFTLVVAAQSKQTWAITRSLQKPCAPEIYFVATSDPSVSFYAPIAAALSGMEIPDSFHVLSMAPQDHRIENVRETGFDLVVIGPRRVGGWERLYRNTPMEVGHEVTMAGATVRVEQVQSGWPSRLKLDFGRPLSSPEFCFVDYRDGNIVELTMPEIGETRLLRRELGPGRM